MNDAAKGVSMKRKLTLRGKVITDVFTCNSDEKHQYDYVLIFTNRPVVQGTKEIDTRLTDAPQYELITGVKKQLTDNVFTCETKGAEVKFTLPDKADFEVFVGEATGIPPSNPSVKTNDDAGSRPVQSCYPLIIRIKEKNALVRADWKLK
ncbi:hypothetical protein SDC9_86782 [bioreactor metagenome]|uniref:Uncharacterized protein n=1 Tax=bioreactor metagenome TaxID=1076179 RepID=A0A644ZN73_9ZZZZ